MNLKTIFRALVPVCIIFFGCKQDEQQIISSLKISPEIVFIENENDKIYLSAQPHAKVDWKIQSAPSWLEITPSSGKLQNNIVEISYRVKVEDLKAGLTKGIIEIQSPQATTAKSTLFVTINEYPVASIDKAVINIHDPETESGFNITNTGNGALLWNIETDQQWLSVSPKNHMVYQNETAFIKVIVNREHLLEGANGATIKINSNSVVPPEDIQVVFNVAPEAILRLSTNQLVFGHFQSSKEFYLKNVGNTSTEWHLEIDDDYILPSLSSGILPRNDSVLINFEIKRDEMQSQSYFSNLRFAGTFADDVLLPIRVDHYIEEKWLLNGYVINAAYDRNHDYLYLLQDGLNAVRRLNPETREITDIHLTHQPLWIAIADDGNYAAIGHIKSVSYVNLQNLQVEAYYTVNFSLSDLLLANNWIYLIPGSDANTRIRCLNLDSGEITLHTGYSPGSGLRINRLPGSDVFYCNLIHSNSGYLHKFDISNGTANYLYSSVNNSGGYLTGSRIWITDEGSRIISRNLYIFRLTSNPADDMTYNGQLGGGGTILYGFDYSSAAGVSFGIIDMQPLYNGPSNSVRKYNNEYLTFIEDIELPKYLYPTYDGNGSFFEPEAYHLFINSYGTKVYVVTKSRQGSGSLSEWAIATIEID